MFVQYKNVSPRKKIGAALFVQASLLLLVLVLPPPPQKDKKEHDDHHGAAALLTRGRERLALLLVYWFVVGRRARRRDEAVGRAVVGQVPVPTAGLLSEECNKAGRQAGVPASLIYAAVLLLRCIYCVLRDVVSQPRPPTQPMVLPLARDDSDGWMALLLRTWPAHPPCRVRNTLY